MRSLAWPGLEVTIRVNGAALHEYESDDTETGDDKEVIRFVESSSGQQFDVALKTDRSFRYHQNDLCTHLYIDGHQIGNGWIGEKRYRDSFPRLALRHMNYTDAAGNYVAANFTFAQLETSDTTTTSCPAENVAGLGQVRVEIVPMKVTGTSNEISRATEPSWLNTSTGVIPEKALKGRSISNRAKLANPRASTPVPLVQTRYPFGTTPIVTFIFNYRSRQDLQIEGMIARPRSPTPLEDRDPDTLTLEEARELLRRNRDRQGSITTDTKVHIKQEKRERSTPAPDVGHDGDSDSEVTVVEEYSRASKRARNSEVVDLTED